jgi:3-hydroxyacyl-CoA dehydrogenase/enoyl-CoA hydratase/3-hydroxybutyryl-CoA epimerase
MHMQNFKLEIEDGGIAIATFDVPGRSMNTLSPAVLGDLAEVARQVASDDRVRGLVLRSGKTSGFCAGADLISLSADLTSSQAGAGHRNAAAYADTLRNHAIGRLLETCGKPIVAALDGLALGGGLEIALLAHRRIAADDARIRLGLPEVTVGLLPGGGGAQRLARLIGYRAAAEMILNGALKSPREALALGFIDEVVPPGATLDAARAWLDSSRSPRQPWDEPGYRVPESPAIGAGAAISNALAARVAARTFGNYPAQEFLLSALHEGLQLPIDSALRVEARYFTRVKATRQATAMVRSLFVSSKALAKGANRPSGVPAAEFRRVAVLGAGMMGAGIAHVQALAGIETILLDQDQAAAERGKDHSRRLLAKAAAAGAISEARAGEVLGLIRPTTNYSELQGADMVIEAVFENQALKEEVIARAEAQLPAAAIFGTNTSTLPVGGLANASGRPENFIGVHFFSPVDRMSLVEIILGAETSRETLARAMDYVMKIRKTPIVVKDSRGFYTSRCYRTYPAEGMTMLAEGISPAIIDNVGRMTGMPRGPLELSDDVGLDLSHRIRSEMALALGDQYRRGPVDDLLAAMVEDGQRFGRKNGRGFYDYPQAPAKKRLWSGLKDLAPVRIAECSPELARELKARLLYIQALEAARCVEEGVIADPRDVDVGAILGWGFARWTGGPLSLIDGIGAAAFTAACDRLADKYGQRFEPGALLRQMARRGGAFYGKDGVRSAA